MSIGAGVVCEVRTAGNDTNGGAFVPGTSGTDFSQQDNKRTGTGSDDSTTDAVANGSTTLTSATANFTSAIVGNVISLSGGTGALAQTWRQVMSRTNSTTIVLDATVATGTGITMNIGGALGGPGRAGFIVALSNGTNCKTWIKAGTYTITSATANAAGGCYSTNFAGTAVEGYVTTRGDNGSVPPLLKADGVITNFTLLTLGNANCILNNVDFDGNSRTGSKGCAIRGNGYKITASNFLGAAFSSQAGVATNLYYCSAYNCSVTPFGNFLNCFDCVAYTNTATGFSGGTMYDRCVSYGNTGASSDGFGGVVEGTFYLNCVAYGNGRHGFTMPSTAFFAANCIAEANTGTGFLMSGSTNPSIMRNCAYYNNGTNVNISNNTNSANISPVLGTSSFFTSAPTDLSLNNNAGGGALLKSTGIPGAISGVITSPSYTDIGIIQRNASGGGGGGAHSAVF